MWNPCRWPRVNQVLKEKFKNFNFSPLHNNSPIVYNLHLYNFCNLFCTEYSIHVWNPCRWPRVNQVKEKFKNFNFSPLHNNSPVNGKMSSSSCSTVFFNFYVQCKTCTNSYSFGGIHCSVHKLYGVCRVAGPGAQLLLPGN